MHTLLAALVNPQCHYDLQALPVVEQVVMIEDLLHQIEETKKFNALPFNEALRKTGDAISE